MLTLLPARRPLALSLGLTVCLLLSLVAAGAATQILHLRLATPVPLAFVPIAVILAGWATRGRRWRALGYRTPVTGGAALTVTVTTCVLILAVVGGSIGAWHWDTLPAWLAFTALVAFVEETFFRGVVLRLLLASGWRRAWLLSSAIFGLGHAANLLSGTQTLVATLLQIGVAFAWGLFTAASYLRTLSLWPALVLHALFDCLELAGLHPSPTWADTVVLVLLLAGAAALGDGVNRATFPLRRAVSLVG